MIFGPKKLKYKSSDVNVVFDGNSIPAGVGASSSAHYIPALMSAAWPITGSGITVNNQGKSGYTWRMLNGLDTGSTGIDSLFAADKKNVLFVMETRNSVCNGGRNSSQTIGDAQDYITARLAARAWRIVLLTAPYDGSAGTQGQIDSYCTTIKAVNDYFVANYRLMGAVACVDLHATGAPYAFTNFNLSTFATARTAGLYQATDYTHPGGAGHAVIAASCCQTAARLSA